MRLPANNKIADLCLIISALALILAPEVYAQSVEEAYQQGLKLLEAGDTSSALDIFSGITAFNSAHKMAWYQQGVCLFRLGKYDKALDIVEKTLILDSQFTFGWNLKGNILEALSRPDEALACYNIALDLDPWLKAVWLNRGILHNKQSDYIDAEGDIKKAVSLGEGSVQAYLELGYAQLMLGEASAAQENLVQAEKLDAKNAYLYYYKACFAAQKGTKSDMLSYLEKALVLNPELAKRAFMDEAFIGYWKDKDFDQLLRKMK
jgi:tetratricopeptide (TPR) repeat protein